MKKLIILFVTFTVLLSGCTSTISQKTDTVEVLEYHLPDTDQSFVYDEKGNIVENVDESSPYYGADASIEGYSLSYKDNGDGTVTDLNTGLMWQKTPDFTRMTFDEALEYCDSLELGGYDDWRLASIKELYSLAYFDGEIIPEGESRPYINTDYFDFQYDRLLFAGQYWSSTVYVKGGRSEL